MRDLEFTNNPKIELIYDIIAGILAIVAVLVVMLQFSTTLTEIEVRVVKAVDSIVYSIFILDYFARLFTSKNKKNFIKHNFIDLIAIFPYELCSSLTYGPAFKLIRVITYVLRLIGNVKEILFTNGFIYALCSTVLITILGSIGIYVFETGVSSTIKGYGDALWWSFVTVTTVGYGDISPTTNAGRLIACILMLTGIGFLSMLTSTISTFFFSAIQKKKYKKIKDMEDECILDISELDSDKRKTLISYYEYLRSLES